MADVLPARWKRDACLVPIPPRHEALRKRGFDHMALVGESLSALTGCPCQDLLAHRRGKDQRLLGEGERQRNMSEAFVLTRERPPRRVILVDDVFTTGATLYAAARVLKDAGATEVYGLTFLHA